MLWFNFSFSLFLCMVMYNNEYKTKETKNCTKDKFELHKILYKYHNEQNILIKSKSHLTQVTTV